MICRILSWHSLVLSPMSLEFIFFRKYFQGRPGANVPPFHKMSLNEACLIQSISMIFEQFSLPPLVFSAMSLKIHLTPNLSTRAYTLLLTQNQKQVCGPLIMQVLSIKQASFMLILSKGEISPWASLKIFSENKKYLSSWDRILRNSMVKFYKLFTYT